MKRLHDPGALFASLNEGQSLVLHSACAEPNALARQLAVSAPSMQDAQLHTLMPMGEAPYAEPEPAAQLRLHTFFPGRGLRAAFNGGRVRALRYPLSAIPTLFDWNVRQADVLLLQVSPPDPSGHVTLGISVDYMQAVLRRRPLVIAEVNPAMPSTCGDTRLPVDAISWYVDACAGPQALAPAAPDPIDQRIATHVASLVRDGAILQIGIGALPDAVLAQLGHLRHLGLHSGIITDAVRPLLESGVIDNSTKTHKPGVSVATMAGGSQAFYDFLDRNAAIEFHPCSLTHQHALLAGMRGLCAINSVLQVDLGGRANAEQVRGRQIALPGGLPDFAAGAAAAEGGLSIIALRAALQDGEHSNIVASFGAEVPVALRPEQIDYVVTEYGIAPIRGTSLAERARGLIAIAHPACREALERQFATSISTEPKHDQ